MALQITQTICGTVIIVCILFVALVYAARPRK